MDQAAHPWVLIVDADERVTPALAREIGDLLEKGPSADHYFLRRDNVFLDRVIRHSGWGQDRLVRLLRRGTARYPEQRVHADMHPDGSTPTLEVPLLHYTLRSLPHYLEKLHRYAEWGAQDLAPGRGERAGFVEVALRPAWRFFRMFVLEAGFLDGLQGFVVCALQSYGVFIKWARLWELPEEGLDSAGLPCRRGRGFAPPSRSPPGGSASKGFGGLTQSRRAERRRASRSNFERSASPPHPIRRRIPLVSPPERSAVRGATGLRIRGASGREEALSPSVTSRGRRGCPARRPAILTPSLRGSPGVPGRSRWR